MWTRRLLCLSPVCAAVPVRAGAAPLRIALLPSMGVRSLLTLYRPLRMHLEQALGQTVEMLTAPDYRHHHAGTLAGDFDMVLTAAHLARHAQLHAGFVPVAMYGGINCPVVITGARQALKNAGQLKGQALAVFDPSALVALKALEWLEDHGLHAGKDFRLAVHHSQVSVTQAVIQGEAQAGVVTTSGYHMFSHEQRELTRVFIELPAVPSLMWMAHPRLARQVPQLRAELIGYGKTPEGQQFLAETAYLRLREVRTEDLSSLDRVALRVPSLLKEDIQ